MMRSQSAKVIGFILLTLALLAILLSQIFTVSVSHEVRLVSASELLMDAIYTGGSIAQIESMLDANPVWACEPIYEDWYAVHCAGQAGRPDVLQVLLNHGADINQPGGPDHANVVVSAFDSNDPETLAFVLDNGADPHIRLADGSSPLEYVRQYGDEELQKVLDDRGLPNASP